MDPLTRREFVRRATLAAAVTQLPGVARAAATDSVPAGASEGEAAVDTKVAALHWLEGRPAVAGVGATLGVPWPRGQFTRDTAFAVRTADGRPVASQTWPLATWPDGSLKWIGVALATSAPIADEYQISAGPAVAPPQPLTATESNDAIEIDTGVITCRIPRRGAVLVESIRRGSRVIARDGRLVALTQNAPEVAAGTVAAREEFTSRISAVMLEQRGPVRAVVKIEGQHVTRAGGARAWLPFTVRLYFHAGGEAMRVMHTFVFDGDEQKDFICGLGLTFKVPLTDALYDRHVRFAGEDDGLWAEAVQGLTGLRRDPGAAVRAAQLAGRATPPKETWAAAVVAGLKYVPVWNDFTLSQLSADGFEIRKRTKAGQSWLKAGYGRRAGGSGYVGGASGGVAFGIRNFWQSHPTQLDVRGAAAAEAEVTLWLWSPEAAPMDLRFYHDGMGQDTYAKQLEGLDITYEDYEPGFATAHGVARTSEMTLWAVAATPSREQLVQMAAMVRMPPVLACRPAHYHGCDLFGSVWNLVDRSTPARAQIEGQLDFNFDYYRRQIEQHHWYGFWNFGDVMHTYDTDRHTWRYDIGGFAWDNSELSPDLWLWYSFLRSGRADIFRVAEAMTRHTGEVDVYHLGRFKGLGSRHNVMHWGCSAKQVRISTAVYRRFYYYLTADERVGDLLHELIDCDERLVTISPGRKVGRNVDTRHPANISFGTDWCSFAAAWLTEWERTGDTKWRDKILAGLKSIGTMPKGWFNSGGGYDPATGMIYPHDDRASASHLNAVFGAVEISAELLQLLNAPEYERAWLQYCEVYNAEPAEQIRLMGQRFENNTLRQGHSRLTAYVAMRRKDPKLAARAWREFRGAGGGLGEAARQTRRISGPAVLNPVDEAARISTNGTAQFGLAAIQCLALAGDSLT
jgi:hypothetical protein